MEPGANPLDSDLISRAQGGDPLAFEALVERHRDQVYGVALRLTRSEADAADIAQETFLSAYEHLSDFRKEAAFGTWLHRIAANKALSRLRHQKVEDSAQADLRGPEFNERGSLAEAPGPDWSRPADDQVLDAELRQAIEQATDRLPAGHREVFLLKDVDGLTYEQIAELLGEGVPAVKSRIHRARLALREAIEAFYKEKS
jgi:RNA polymerase sigma-70 factor, ECF subfamily